MPKQLVIVESPTKAKTLERYLGSGYSVAASRGHVRDLPEDRMGVDPEQGFTPEYEIKPDSKETIGRSKSVASQRPSARGRPSPGTSPKRSAPIPPRPIVSPSPR